MMELLAKLVQARMPWVSPRIRSWYDEQRLSEQLAADLAPEAERVGSVDFGTAFRDMVDADLEPDPLAWANRLLELDNGGWALAGVRFRALDRAKPFVDVVATDQPATPDGLASVAAVVLPAFAVFAPLRLRVDAPDRRRAHGSPRCRSSVRHWAVRRSTSTSWPDWWPRPAVGGSLHLQTATSRLQARRAGAAGRDASRRSTGSTLRTTRLWATPEDAESLAE